MCRLLFLHHDIQYLRGFDTVATWHLLAWFCRRTWDTFETFARLGNVLTARVLPVLKDVSAPMICMCRSTLQAAYLFDFATVLRAMRSLLHVANVGVWGATLVKSLH